MHQWIVRINVTRVSFQNNKWLITLDKLTPVPLVRTETSYTNYGPK